MKKAVPRLAVWLLTIWLVFCPAARANTNQPALPSDKQREAKGTAPAAATDGNVPQVWPAVETPLTVLEQRLFSDAADGRLDEFSLLAAALIASGVDDQSPIRRYEERVAGWANQLRQSGRLACSSRQQVEVIFAFLHGKILYGGYNIECTDLRQALDQGRFNCVSATVLFNSLAGKLGLPCCALETPGHASSRVFLPDGPLDLETTCPRWFQLQHDPAKQAEALEKTIGRKPAGDKTKRRELSPLQLAAMIYYNRGVDFLSGKNFPQAAAANIKALRLDPLNGAARGNYLATINNWSIELCKSGRYAQAAALLRQGLVLDPHYETFALNFLHVHHQWSAQLCKQKRYPEAVDLLSRAAAEMPDREYFPHAVWEVYRRWARELLEADQIDQALAVFAEARRRQGFCREELDYELAALIEHGQKLLAQSRYQEARKIFDRILILRNEATAAPETHQVAEKSRL
jgi:hypothetical protein